MIEKIHWYLVPKDKGMFTVKMASSARILEIISQDSELKILALVPLYYEDIDRRFRLAGIGDSAGEGDDILKYVGVFFQENQEPLCLFEVK